MPAVHVTSLMNAELTYLPWETVVKPIKREKALKKF